MSAQEQASNEVADEGETNAMKMSIDGTDVTVEWEDNQAVADLKALVANAPLTVDLSMYGGFEQVGPLGTKLTANDVQTTTTAGDIVLYSGNQIVVFYGSNSWAYTRLGHITSQTSDGMASLLGNGDVSITIASGNEE
ncbi:MAG: cyclophilin-like fold protein [Coriobacteriales bacterium]|nr:cyclophilin-like fold protein [Coriobacteriales bacterium]